MVSQWRKISLIIEKQDTPERVCKRGAVKVSKMAYQREIKSGKISKFFSKNTFSPLEKKNRFMYNLPVVCLGMKW